MLLHTEEDWTAFSEAHLLPGSGLGASSDACVPHKHVPRADALEMLRRSLQRNVPLRLTRRKPGLKPKRDPGAEPEPDLWEPSSTYGRAVKKLHQLTRWSYYDELGAPKHENRTVR